MTSTKFGTLQCTLTDYTYTNQIIVEVPENHYSNQGSYTLTIKNSTGDSDSITITQSGQAAPIPINYNLKNATYNGEHSGVFTAALGSVVSMTIVPDEGYRLLGAADPLIMWRHNDVDVAGVGTFGDGILSFNVDSKASYYNISFEAVEDVVESYIDIESAVYTLNEQRILGNLSYEAGAYFLKYVSTSPVTESSFSIPETQWISIDSITADRVYFSVTRNEKVSKSDRSIVLTLKNAQGETDSAVITQTGVAAASLVLAPGLTNSQNMPAPIPIPATGDNYSFRIINTSDDIVSVTADVPWITIRFFNRVAVGITVSDNNSTDQRTGVITVDNGRKTATKVVEQEGTEATIFLGSVSDSNGNLVTMVPANSGSLTYYMEYYSTNPVTATINYGTIKQIKSNEIVFQITDNMSDDYRNVFIEVSDSFGNSSTKTLRQAVPAKYLRLDQRDCTACGLCDGLLDVCPVGLEIKFDGSGYAVIDDLSNCIGCGLCNAGICPSGALYNSDESGDMVYRGQGYPVGLRFNESGYLEAYLANPETKDIKITMRINEPQASITRDYELIIPTGQVSVRSDLNIQDFDFSWGDFQILKAEVTSPDYFSRTMSSNFIDEMDDVDNTSYNVIK